MKGAGIEFSFAFTEFKHHAVQIAVDAIGQGYRKLLAIGGDGTLNEVVNGIFVQKAVPASEFVLGVIAVGTGNDWLRMYQFPRDYAGQVEIIRSGEIFRQDVGIAEYYETEVKKSRYFINSAGSGFDAEVVRSTNKLKDAGRSGMLLYMISLLKALIGYRSTHVDITVDDFSLSETVFSLSVGIGRYSGAGMRQVPFALTDDGFFDVTIIRKMSKLNVLANIPRLYNGTILKHSRIVGIRGCDVEITSIPRVNLEADGETLGHSPFRFSILPKAIGVMVSSEFVRSSSASAADQCAGVLLGSKNI